GGLADVCKTPPWRRVSSVSWATLLNQESDMIVIPRSIALRAFLNLIIALPPVVALRMYEGSTR
ncbi:hypothetical protein, partial [Pseudomonas savastanoi]